MFKIDCYWLFKVTIADDGKEQAEGYGIVSKKLAAQKKQEFLDLPKEGEYEKDGVKYAYFRAVFDKAGPTTGFTLGTSVVNLNDETCTEYRLVFKALPVIKDAAGDTIKFVAAEGGEK